MTIGEKIKTFRKIAGLTQQELAENVGVSRSHLASIETGKYQPSIETLMMRPFSTSTSMRKWP